MLKRIDWIRDRFGFPSTQAAYDAVRRGLIPSIRIGRRVYFEPQAIEDWLRSQSAKSLRGSETDAICSICSDQIRNHVEWQMTSEGPICDDCMRYRLSPQRREPIAPD